MAGINRYNKVLDALLCKGIQPFVTLTHYEIPQELEERNGAWLSPKIQKDFEYYADMCFKYFGKRVKYWMNFNEPNVMAVRGCRSGIYPPSRCIGSFGNCSKGHSEKEPLIAAHNMILSHSVTVDIYGFTGLNTRFLDHIITGKYPQEIHQILGSLLPVFSRKYLKKLRNGLDFIGINHCTSFYSKD
ncbi:unnamed protein product [Fraxinus pennsylvanica]|uniref:Uncharacterized protein n=1 Tax=Fraxinus pennsylvanica TaxID=56036 RepID=A0AAD2A9D2_9LAMI|nr:unnamed protein product [Fraxinus pennsylvanica]